MTDGEKRRSDGNKGPDKRAEGVTLPPIDAEPEEIARALFQRPPLKKRKDEQSGAEDRWPKKRA